MEAEQNERPPHQFLMLLYFSTSVECNLKLNLMSRVLVLLRAIALVRAERRKVTAYMEQLKNDLYMKGKNILPA